jgi:hypothetical protein
MKNILFLSCFVLAAVSSQAQCPNGDLEMGTLTPPWQGYLNTAPTTGVTTPTAYTAVPGTASARHVITTSGSFDPLIPTLPQVASGSYAVKLGNISGGSESEILSYTFTLTPDFSFNYATVAESIHPPAEDAYFAYWISLTDVLPVSTMSGNLLAMEEIRSDHPGLTPYPGTLFKYKPWAKECVMGKFPSLAPYVGRSVTIYFITADCIFNGHGGYAYIDDLCKSTALSFTAPTAVGYYPPAFNPITIDGTASGILSSYYYEVVECDASGIPIPGGVSENTPTYYGMPVAFDLRAVLSSGFFKPTTYYKIILHDDCAMGLPPFKIVYLN